MRFDALPIPGAFEVRSDPRGDARGRFGRGYCAEEFAAAGLPVSGPQMNLSETAAAGTLRGMHFQRAPATEGKLVRCVAGEAYDVVLDLRAGSPTRGRWAAVTLSAEAMNAVFVPEGCAHGFQALSPGCTLHYMHTVPYAPGHEGGVDALDPDVGIAWPLPVTLRSERDAALPPVHATEPL